MSLMMGKIILHLFQIKKDSVFYNRLVPKKWNKRKDFSNIIINKLIKLRIN